jgi:hypothetical protein
MPDLEDDAAIRAAIVAFMLTPAITGIQDWYNDEPWFLDGGKWALKDNGGWGSIGFVHLDSSSENRIASGGQVFTGPTPNMPTGQKREIFKVSLVIQYQFLIPAQLPTGKREDMWVAPIDQIIVDVKKRIRSDPSFGTGPGGVILQAGQGDGRGGPHISQTRDLPVMNEQRTKLLNWNRIQFDAQTIITA